MRILPLRFGQVHSVHLLTLSDCVYPRLRGMQKVVYPTLDKKAAANHHYMMRTLSPSAAPMRQLESA